MWRRQAPKPSVELTAESVVRVPGPTSRVWALVKSPASAVALFPECIDAWREPGSPVGLGEVQVSLMEVAGVRHQYRNKIIAFEDGRRAVTELADPGFGARLLVETVVSPINEVGHDDVEVTHRRWAVLATEVPAEVLAAVQQELDRWAQTISSRLPAHCVSASLRYCNCWAWV